MAAKAPRPRPSDRLHEGLSAVGVCSPACHHVAGTAYVLGEPVGEWFAVSRFVVSDFSFFAGTLPRNTDEALWSEGRSMRLLFDLPNHPPPAGTSTNVVQATLRLFKVSQGGATTHTNHGPLCVPSVATTAAAAAAFTNAEDDDGLLEGDGRAPVPLHALLGMAHADDRQVRVSVYWYTRSLKKNKNGGESPFVVRMVAR